ncbi:MAG: FHA domain-containing protein [Chloroflexi bacterium]|nr:FHA domain-containing protein [Chloroflexota bacterium]
MAFKCRECPRQIRECCIEQSGNSHSVKLLMRSAFEASTDTVQMWDMLQASCLLRSRVWTEAELTPDSPPERRTWSHQSARSSDFESYETDPQPDWQSETSGLRKNATRYGLSPQTGLRRIALPVCGEVVLGRFDPLVQATPDVDLNYLNRMGYQISRRHVRIIARDGQHEIEDIGSTSGTMINWRRLRMGQRVHLTPGDRVTLGQCDFVYEALPDIPPASLGVSFRAYVVVTATGHRHFLPSSGLVVIGRNDRAVGLVPDIDLGREGPIAQGVARRHTRIVVRNGRHYAEDLGSASGTRLNGSAVQIGQAELLSPGDHLWLGGCTLGYDIAPVK